MEPPVTKQMHQITSSHETNSQNQKINQQPIRLHLLQQITLIIIIIIDQL